MTDLDVPRERDLPPGRLAEMKAELLARIQVDRTAPPSGATGRVRWRRAAVAAVAAGALAVGGVVALGGGEPASANTAVLDEDGNIVVTVEEGKDPEALERRLEDLGVPAEVDFLESGFSCDRSRSTGWTDSIGDLVVDEPGSPSGRLVLDPDALAPGQTVALEFHFDDLDRGSASLWTVAVSDTPVGPCEPVPSAAIVDAERGIAGG